MSFKKLLSCFSLLFVSNLVMAQKADQPDFRKPVEIKGMKLVWNDEFNQPGPPNPASWRHEKGFVRNNEHQWYQPENAYCKGGLLVIEGRKTKIPNPLYKAGSEDWRTKREFIEYTSSSIQTRGMHQWKFGRFEVRARIDTTMGAWPAIWTLGVEKEWPHNGEIDIMEFYRVKGVPTILANVAWGTEKRYSAKWDETKIPFSKFAAKDKNWVNKFHIWRMEWDEKSIKLFLDDELLNEALLSESLNPDGSSPFKQPHYLLLNLALGGNNGGDPAAGRYPVKYEVDYVRVYQRL